MKIKHRKIVLVLILILSNVVTIAGIIELEKYNGNINDSFQLFMKMSFGILIIISMIYILHYIIYKVSKVKMKNYSILNDNLKQKQDILFKWNRRKDTILYSANIYKKYSIEMIRKNFMKSLMESNNILEQHKERLSSMIDKLINGSSYEQIEVELKNIDGNYSWVRISCTAIINRFGELSKIVGVISDIDEEKEKNKELIFKAERDSLTKVYNRGKFIELVNNYFKEANKDNNIYLVMIDVDDFKFINDNLGHIYGDKALIDLTTKLKNRLKDNELIGRLGGDEICLLIECSCKEGICKRASDIVNLVKNVSVGDNEKINISASIGIAQYLRDGKSFEELYEKSDKSMYKAKEKGKGRYIIYDEY